MQRLRAEIRRSGEQIGGEGEESRVLVLVLRNILQANQPLSGSADNQVIRFNTLIKQAEKAMNESIMSLIIGDVKQLVPIYDDFLNNNNLTIVNHEMTRFETNAPASLLDHIITNEPNRVDYVETNPSLISDHILKYSRKGKESPNGSEYFD